jgi:hypothetical protein
MTTHRFLAVILTLTLLSSLTGAVHDSSPPEAAPTPREATPPGGSSGRPWRQQRLVDGGPGGDPPVGVPRHVAGSRLPGRSGSAFGFAQGGRLPGPQPGPQPAHHLHPRGHPRHPARL